MQPSVCNSTVTHAFPPAGPGLRPSWIDNLDQACFNHDKCLQTQRYDVARTKCSAPGFSGMVCHCEYALRDAANAIYNAEKRCSWWAFWCVETQKVAAALAINQAMAQRVYCGSC